MKREHDPDVLRHSVEGVHDYLHEKKPAGGGGGDSVRDLILSETGELLDREVIVGGPVEDSIRAKLFSTYATLAATPDVLHFAADARARNRSLGTRALAEYLESLNAEHLLLHSSRPQTSHEIADDTTEIMTNIIRLMDALPLGEERSRASEFLAQLPADRLTSLFTVSFAGKPNQYAERSAEIYVRSWPTVERRRSEAKKLLKEMARRLDQLVNQIEEPEIPKEQLVYILASIQYLQPEADVRDQKLFDNVRSLLSRRDEHRDSDVIDVACAAFAALSANQEQRSDLADLAPLREIVAGRSDDIDFRCAAARALGLIDHETIVNDLAAIATATAEPIRLRRDSIKSLSSIGRRRLARNEKPSEIIAVFASLFDTGKYQSDELLPDAVSEIAAIGELEVLDLVLSTLSRGDRDLNLQVHDAVFVMLLRYPLMAERIAEQSMEAIADLSDEAKNSLFPPQEQFLADVVQMRQSMIEADEFTTACRQLAQGLATIVYRHDNPSVRRLSHDNLSRLLSLEELPEIDPDDSETAREAQYQQWHGKWTTLKDRLYVNDDLQFEVR
jgi:hypothetical protein